MRFVVPLLLLLIASPALADGPTELDLDGDGVPIDDGDCDDTRAWIFPDAPEACDGRDSDCDGHVPSVGGDSELDEDGDGWRVCAGDCDDRDETVHPHAPEGCDGKDSDCSGVAAATERDRDGDGYAPCQGDCDDGDPLRAPDPGDVCDGQDEDCDGVIDEGCDENEPGDDDDLPGGCTSRGCGWSFRPGASPQAALLACGAFGLAIGRRRRIGSP